MQNCSTSYSEKRRRLQPAKCRCDREEKRGLKVEQGERKMLSADSVSVCVGYCVVERPRSELN